MTSMTAGPTAPPTLSRGDTAAPADRGELLELIGEAYQVVAVLAIECGRFDDPRVVKLLDNLAEGRRVHADVLPFPSTPA